MKDGLTRALRFCLGVAMVDARMDRSGGAAPGRLEPDPDQQPGRLLAPDRLHPSLTTARQVSKVPPYMA